MKIGILTYHRSQNYGALLQALAMQQFLEDQGHTVSFVDYWPSYHEDEYKLFSWSKLKKLPLKNKITYIIRFFGTCIRTPIRRHNTRHFINRFLHVSQDKKFDVVVYGSDQIWRRQSYTGFQGFNPVYFGEGFVETSYKVAYAASMGEIKIQNDADIQLLAKCLKNFNAIGVREADLKDFVENKFNIPCKLVLDPVFLLTKEQWLTKLNSNCLPKYKYILHYQLDKNVPTDKLVEVIVCQTGLPVIDMKGVVPLGHYGKKNHFTDGPQEFLSLINGAEFVVASSFHAVALSVCFEKEFYMCAEMQRISRLKTLLSQLGLTDHIIEKNHRDVIDTHKRIDYMAVNKKLFELEQESREWLINTLIH